MKNFIKLMTFAAAMLCMASCANSIEEPQLTMGEGEGVLTLNINYVATRSDEAAVENFSMKIYRYAAADENGERAKELVRKYTSRDAVPQYIWLLQDQYCVSVKVGEKEQASFESKYFEGESDFAITPGKIAEVDLKCNMVNIPVAVAYDANIASHFTKEFYSYVCASNSFDLDSAKGNKVPTLKYTSSTTGYFILPEGCTTLSWYFYGNDGTDAVSQTGIIENVKPLTLYTLKFKYSKDAPGGVVVTAKVDTSAEHREDKVPFSPDPTVKGNGFNVDNVYAYTSGERTYFVNALDNITQLNIVADGTTFDLLASTYPGIAVNAISGKEYHITLSYDFFNSLAGGEQTLAFRIKDASGGVGYVESPYQLQGVLPLNSTDYDLWFNSADFKAQAFGSPSNIEIGYRIAGGEWKKFAASAASAANQYNALANEFAAGKNYEYAMFVNSVQVGRALTINTPDGAQIPESDFENWTHLNNKVWCPTAVYGTGLWDTGNHATGTLDLENLTYASNDVRPGSTGTKSAYLHSIKASVMGVGKFAAGNLFVGTFIRISGMGGILDFGKPFTYTARPKAVRMWVKYNVGTIDNKGDINASGPDLAKIYICLCNTTTPYRVDTNDSKTLFDPRTSPNIVANGVFESHVSNTEWHLLEIPIEYKDENTKPNFLVMTLSCSGYGDYFAGSTASWMYVDDLELVY